MFDWVFVGVHVAAFQCHPDGCPMVLYAPQHQVLVSGGKKGEICIFDVRQRQLRQTFQAHETNVAIRCLALDSGSGSLLSVIRIIQKVQLWMNYGKL